MSSGTAESTDTPTGGAQGQDLALGLGFSHRDGLVAVAEQVHRLQDRLVIAETQWASQIAGVEHSNLASAVNLAHYWAIRQTDLRDLQQQLASFGLSSLGLCEPHVETTLGAIATTVDVLTVSCGQALQWVLLRARTADVWSSHLNQPIEVAALRPTLAEIVGRPGQFPQLLVRFGFGDAVKAQPRRPVDDVVIDSPRH